MFVMQPYQYSRDIYDLDDTSDEEINGSSALTGEGWQSEQQEEEDRLLQIAKSVLDEKAGKPPKVKKVFHYTAGNAFFLDAYQ